MSSKQMELVPFGRATYANRMASNPNRLQWGTAYSSSYSTNDPRNFIDMDLALHYTKDTVWEGGPSEGGIYDHGREHAGYWTYANGPNINPSPNGGNADENNFFILKATNKLTKMVYNMGHTSTIATSGASDRGPPSTETCCIGLQGMYKPRSDSVNNYYAAVGVKAVYMMYSMNLDPNYWSNLIQTVQSFLSFLQCIQGGGSVPSCIISSGFSAIETKYQNRAVSALIDQYEFTTGNRIEIEIPPELIEIILEKLLEEIGDSLDQVIQDLEEFITRSVALIEVLVNVIQGFGGDSNIKGPDFIAKLTPTVENRFQLGKETWDTEPPEDQRFFSGEVSDFVQRFVAFAQLGPNGGLHILQCPSNTGLIARDRRMEVYDWSPIWAPGGGRREEPNAMKVLQHYDKESTNTITIPIDVLGGTINIEVPIGPTLVRELVLTDEV